MFKRALISCSDKTNLVEFLKSFPDLEIVSSGGTADFLSSSGFKVTRASEVTQFPEILGGRVKTLHPHIHAGLLARANHLEDQKTLQELQIKTFDLVVVNLYPFAEHFEAKSNWATLIENIDIGGPAMLRSSAKNYESVTVIVDPSDYSFVASQKSISLEQRKELAGKVFAHTAQYDSLVAKAFSGAVYNEWPEKISFTGGAMKPLRYGENPQQKAAWYQTPGASGLHQAEVIQGKPLSYNNILDIDAAVSCLRNCKKVMAVGVKHNNPCAAAQGDTAIPVLASMLKADPVSIFGGVVSTNFTIGVKEATELTQIFLEVVVAPQYTEEALHVFRTKPNLRILKWPDLLESRSPYEFKSISGGFLVQESDLKLSASHEWKTVGSSRLTDEEVDDVLFGEQIVSQLKSNAIALVSKGLTVGLGMGQVNRIDAVNQAFSRWHSHHPEIKTPILVSDAFFPFPDIIETCVRAGVKIIVHPGGSINDSKVEAAALEQGIMIVYNQKRHFKH